MPIIRARGTTSAKCNALQCETLDLGLEGFSECPQVGPNTCEFAVPFGYGFLCRHPAASIMSSDGRIKKTAFQGEVEQRA